MPLSTWTPQPGMNTGTEHRGPFLACAPFHGSCRRRYPGTLGLGLLTSKNVSGGWLQLQNGSKTEHIQVLDGTSILMQTCTHGWAA